MKSYQTKEGPYPVRLVYEPQEIDQICEDALRKEKLLPKVPEAIKIDLFLERYFGIPVQYMELESGVMGCTIFNTKGAVTGFIISSLIEQDGAKSSERRARSTIAHEGGHGLLHSGLFMADTSTGKVFGNGTRESQGFMCRHSDIGVAKAKAYDGRWWEWQANRAIAGLLLPKKLVARCVTEFLQKGTIAPTLRENCRGEAESLTSTTFDVNPAVARIRLEEMYPNGEQMFF